MPRIASPLPYPDKIATWSHATALIICDAQVMENATPFLGTPVKMLPRSPGYLEWGPNRDSSFAVTREGSTNALPLPSGNPARPPLVLETVPLVGGSPDVKTTPQ